MTTADVTLTYDIGPSSGMGHQRRMQALSAALTDRGAQCSLVPLDQFGPAGVAVVVDSYEVRADEPGRFPTSLLAAVDDLGRDLAVDLLVDPNPPGDDEGPHMASHVLSGPRYSLIGPVPPDLTVRPVGEEPQSILVTFGASGANGYGAALAAALAARLPELTIRLVVGPWGADAPAGVDAVRTENGLFHQLAAADIVITTGGVTLLESLVIGRPTIAVAAAENQRRSIQGSSVVGAIAGFSDLPPIDELVETTVALVTNPESRSALAARAEQYVDAKGPDRIAEALLELL